MDLKKYFTHKFFLSFSSTFPFFSIRKRGKTLLCHHPPIYFSKPSHIYFCLISSLPTSLPLETEMLIRCCFPSRLSFAGLLPFRRPGPVPAKCYELQGKKQPTNQCWQDHKIQSVSVRGIYSQAGEILNFHNIEADNLEEDGIFSLVQTNTAEKTNLFRWERVELNSGIHLWSPKAASVQIAYLCLLL